MTGKKADRIKLQRSLEDFRRLINHAVVEAVEVDVRGFRIGIAEHL